MSYIALATLRFAETLAFYRDRLGFPVLRAWERPGARGSMLDLGGGLRLELLDAAVERRPLELGSVGDRCHLVIEVADLDALHARLGPLAPEPMTTSWGARLVRFADPDGIPISFLEWAEAPPS